MANQKYSKEQIAEFVKQYMKLDYAGIGKNEFKKAMESDEMKKWMAKAPEWAAQYKKAKEDGKLEGITKEEVADWLRENVCKEAADGFLWYKDGGLKDLAKKGIANIPDPKKIPKIPQ